MTLLKKAVQWVSRSFGVGVGDAGAWGEVRARLGVGSFSGETVTDESALQVATAWACVRLLAETIATLPVGMYERTDAGGRRAAADHPLHSLVHDQPNADHTAVEFWEGAVTWLCLRGNAYAEILRVAGRIVALDLLPADQVEPKRRADGALYYRHTADGKVRDLAEEDVFHVRGFGAGGDVGLSPISYARQTLGLSLAQTRAAAKIYASGLRPHGVVEGETRLDKEQRKQFRELLNEYARRESAADAVRVLLLPPGFKFSPMSLSPEDAQLLESQAFGVEEVCRWFRVPPAMIGHTEKQTSWGTGVEQQMIGFLTFSLRPYLVRIEQAIRRCLLKPVERSHYFARFSLDGLMRADSAGRAALYSALAQNGVLTRNEIRALEDREPLPGGDELTVQVNLVPLERLGKVPAA